MLKGGRRRQASGFLQFPDQLPAVERIEKIDKTRAAVENLNRQIPAVLHKDAGWFLVRVAPVFKQQFVCHE